MAGDTRPTKAPRPQGAFWQTDVDDEGDDPAAAGEPFWNSKGFVAGLTAVLSLAGVLGTALVTWINADAALALATAEHDHQRRMDYFSRAIDPASDPLVRERALRMIARTEDDATLRVWAEDELRRVTEVAEALSPASDTLAEAIAEEMAEAGCADLAEPTRQRRVALRSVVRLTTAMSGAICSTLSECQLNLARCNDECSGMGCGACVANFESCWRAMGSAELPRSFPLPPRETSEGASTATP